jgi:hypothetical protein
MDERILLVELVTYGREVVVIVHMHLQMIQPVLERENSGKLYKISWRRFQEENKLSLWGI